MKKIVELIIAKKKIIVITFEIFWIIVFLLDMIASQSGGEIAQFVYVNF